MPPIPPARVAFSSKVIAASTSLTEAFPKCGYTFSFVCAIERRQHTSDTKQNVNRFITLYLLDLFVAKIAATQQIQ